MTNQTINGLREQLEGLEEQRKSLAQSNTQLQAELSDIAVEIRRNPHLPRDRWNKLLTRQGELKRFTIHNTGKICELNPQIRRLNRLISDLESEDYITKRNDIAASSPSAGLAALREKYAKFGADNTRVSSMRLMATQFANELDALIRSEAKIKG